MWSDIDFVSVCPDDHVFFLLSGNHSSINLQYTEQKIYPKYWNTLIPILNMVLIDFLDYGPKHVTRHPPPTSWGSVRRVYKYGVRSPPYTFRSYTCVHEKCTGYGTRSERIVQCCSWAQGHLTTGSRNASGLIEGGVSWLS